MFEIETYISNQTIRKEKIKVPNIGPARFWPAWHSGTTRLYRAKWFPDEDIDTYLGSLLIGITNLKLIGLVCKH